MFVVAQHMMEDIHYLYEKHSNGYLTTAKVRGETMTRAFMEGVQLMETNQMMEAMMCLMAS